MQHTFKTEKGDFLAVGMPKDAKNIRINGFGNLRYEAPFANIISLKGQHEIICHWPDCTEEQADMILPDRNLDKPCGHLWNDYMACAGYDTAIESLASLMEREKIYCKNPYEKPLEGDYGFESHRIISWQQAQERTSENWVILKNK